MMKNEKDTAREMSAARESLSGLQGKKFWRSLDEWADTPEFTDAVSRHFPSQMDVAIDPFTRRTFLKVMGASLAFAGLTGCSPSQPYEKIFPYAANPPEQIIPGRPLYFATGMPLGGFATSVVAESNMGRPTKIDGNKFHPGSLGAANAISQASVLTVYDPDRSQAILDRGRPTTWDNFLGAMTALRDRFKKTGGTGLAILTETVTSPTLAAQMKTLLSADHFPNAKWYQYEPVSRENARAAFGGSGEAVYDFGKADVVVSLDSNFLGEGPWHVGYARAFSSRRKISGPDATINRFYAVESSPSITGGSADHRLRVRASHVETIARAIAQGCGVSTPQGALKPEEQKFVDVAVKDLQAAKGKCVVVAGDYQSAAVHALAAAINQALGNVGQTVTFVPSAEAAPVNQIESLAALTQDIAGSKVDTLVVLGGNPVYNAPADFGFEAAYQTVPLRIHLGEYHDETGFYSHWHIPQAHYLESWGDLKSFDGTIVIQQPLIAPLYDGRTPYEILAALLGQGGRTAYDLVREHWIMQMPGYKPPADIPANSPAPNVPHTSKEFDTWWATALNDGKTTAPNAEAQAAPAAAPQVNAALFAQAPAAVGEDVEIIFRPDPNVWDGRLANNAWLQELPKPLTKLTWDNAAIMSIRLADRVGVKNGDVVTLGYKGRSVKAAVRVLAGHPDKSVTLHLGYGRTRAGRIGNGTGFNAYAIRTSDTPWHGIGLSLGKTGETYKLAVTEHHNMISAGDIHNQPEAGATNDHYAFDNNFVGDGPGFVEGGRDRDIFKVEELGKYKENPHFATEEKVKLGASWTNPQAGHGGEHAEGAGHEGGGHEQASMLPESFKYEGHKWALIIDTQSCIGCNACIVACQSENNIPVVGKEQVLVYRAMHWIRLDTYFSGSIEDPATYFQPVMCMHCEYAPCEIVCPVGATVHSAEGTNDMAYNRCIGTRYCSNNCPYKVRRFNFLHYADQSPLAQLGYNPNVTVRWRGVMEKCTYCIQRISKARITSQREERPIADGEIVTACQQTCPTDAIVFGDLNNAESKVAKAAASERNYAILSELNTKPRTTYLARVTNPNQDFDKA